ncbi:uncharacterized protein [Pyxicephalus adspersus]|uniref:Uncharacterized protein n=1 Tax=Pyxicephalus adspersus TaxID=30357 RepID=A0AAV2ZR16_PYXAD|nr:TPA: hypothetical protein GDO54_017562 [Pyxicephalus adspersus]
MRTFSGSQKTPCKRTNTTVRHIMASDAKDPVDILAASVMEESSLGIEDVAGNERLETEEEVTRTEGSTVLWGEFQGTQPNDGEEEGEWFSRGLHECQPDDSWVAFTGVEDSHSNDEEGLLTQCGGRWWCESSTTLCTREHSPQKSSVGHIFEHCFPQISLPHTEEDIKPLESLLHDMGLQGHRQRHPRDTCDHRAADHTQDPDMLYKWEGSQLRSSYLSSLHIKPNDKVPPNRTRSSPAPKQRVQPHKMSTGLGRELKLMKVASVSVHVTGFSPSHHLQSLFQHWSQPSGKTRLKVAYDFNRSLLV